MKSNFLFLIAFLGISAVILIADFFSAPINMYGLFGFNTLFLLLFIGMHLIFKKVVNENFDQAGMTFMGLTFFGIIIFAIISAVGVKFLNLPGSDIYYLLTIYLIYLGCFTFSAQKLLANHTSK